MASFDPAAEAGLGWLSLQGRWARLMAEGKKTVEWRKSAPRELAGSLFVLWESAPGAQALGIARAGEVWRAPWPQLHERLGERGVATREELAAYYGEKSGAVAIEAAMVERFERPVPWRLLKPLAGGFAPGPAPRWIGGDAGRRLLEALREAQALALAEPASDLAAPLKQRKRGPWMA
jgi:predicted transcriptional regulator